MSGTKSAWSTEIPRRKYTSRVYLQNLVYRATGERTSALLAGADRFHVQLVSKVEKQGKNWTDGPFPANVKNASRGKKKKDPPCEKSLGFSTFLLPRERKKKKIRVKLWPHIEGEVGRIF